MFRLTNTLWFLLALSVLLVGGCKDKYVASADAGVDAGDASVPENTIAACSDGVDNDGDGYTDCLDPECQGFDVCIESDCSDGIDNDGDGNMDCTDTDCQATIECRENTAVACQDSIDNDGDGDTDCDDAECLGFTFCEPTEDICDDNIDNDNDGDTDCDDDDCAQLPICGGFCYAVDFQAPAVWGMAITEANDDLDANAACVQYDVVIQATAPEASTQVCLYVDDINGAAVGCFDPNAQNPISIRVTLCAGEHTLHARVEQGINVCNTVGSGRQQIDIVVYENPSCTITTPAGLSTDQANPTCVTQAAMDLMVTTSGDDVLLYAAGTPFGPEFAVSGLADFTATSLGADADMMIRAHCDNPGTGNGDTWSTDYYITKDTLGPAPQILSPATGASYGISGCPFNMVVTGVEAGQQVCAHYNGQTPLPAACATSTGTSDQHILSVQCVDGLALPVEANTQDACGNPGQATIAVTADTGLPAVLIESPAGGQVYNKAADTIEPATDDFELNIVACTDQDYSPANISLTVDSASITSITPTVQAADCLGLSHRITWSAPFAFSQSVTGLQTPHDVEVTVSDGVNQASAQASFSNDTLAPELSFDCSFCKPSQNFFTSVDDNCTGTSEFEVQALLEVIGIEFGRQVTLAVTNGGAPVGNSPYQMTMTQFPDDYPDFETPCGVELQTGQNSLTASVTDAAGNVATPAVKAVTYGSGLILSPTDHQLLSTADDCDSGAGYGVSVQVQLDHASIPNGTSVEVAVSSASDGWIYPGAGVDVWSKNCTGDPCNHTFCISVPTGMVQQSDIAVDLIISSTTVPGGPRNVIVDISAPDAPNNPTRVITNRRAAEVQLSWDSVEDAESGVLQQWDVRCVEDGTISLANWSSARQFDGEPAPAADGTGQTMLISEDTNGNKIRAGHSYSCAIRGLSFAGMWSDLAVFTDIGVVDLAFLEHSYVLEGFTDKFDWWYSPSIAAAGDVNRDGYDDLLVGFGKAGEGKQSAVYFGSAAGVSASNRLLLTCADASFGSLLVGVGNFDGDAGNYPDIAIAAEDEGRVYVFFGASGLAGLGTLDCANADVVITGPVGTRFGNAIVPVGDFDFDGRRDIAIGAYKHGGNQGAVYVVFGRENPVDVNFNTLVGTNGDIVLMRTTDNRAGASLTAADFDEDGYWDLIIGAPWGGTAGTIEVLLGHSVTKATDTITSYTVTDLDQRIDQISVNANFPAFGSNTLTVSDIDGDGCTDVVVGAHWGNYISADEGVGDVHLFKGVKAGVSCTGSLETLPSHTLYGTAAWDQFGISIGKRMNMTLETPVPWKINGVISSPSDEAIFAGAEQYEYSTPGSVGPGYAAMFWAPIVSNMDIGQADVLFSPPSGAVGFCWASFVGDLNGDGYVDLAVGDPDFSPSGRINFYY